MGEKNRTAIVLPVRFAHGTKAVQTTTREISLAGIFVRCLEPPPAGASVALKLYLPGLATAEELTGTVQEVSTDKDTGFWAQFDALSTEQGERLHALLTTGSIPPEEKRPVPIGVLGRGTGRHPVGLPGPSDAHAPHHDGESPAQSSAPHGLAGPDSSSPAPAAPSPAGGVNRRIFPRYRARFAVRFATVQDFVLEYAANISAGGVFVVTGHPPEMDAVIQVVLELPGGGDPVTAKALVVHRVTPEEAQGSGQPAGVGVQFIEATDEFRVRIDAAIELILANDGKESKEGKEGKDDKDGKEGKDGKDPKDPKDGKDG